MTDLQNNQKIRKYMSDKLYVNNLNEQINKRRIQIDNLIWDLNGKLFSYETNNYYTDNKPFFVIDELRNEIRQYEPMLKKAQELLVNSESQAKGLEWIV
jgi:hypothetical protein